MDKRAKIELGRIDVDIPIELLIESQKREIRKREQCYPRWVENWELAAKPLPEGATRKVNPFRMTTMSRDVAEQELEMARRILGILENMRETGYKISIAEKWEKQK